MSKHDDKEKLLQKFDELISSSRLHLNLAEGTTIDDLTDEDKISVVKQIEEFSKKRGEKNE